MGKVGRLSPTRQVHSAQLIKVCPLPHRQTGRQLKARGKAAMTGRPPPSRPRACARCTDQGPEQGWSIARIHGPWLAATRPLHPQPSRLWDSQTRRSLPDSAQHPATLRLRRTPSQLPATPSQPNLRAHSSSLVSPLSPRRTLHTHPPTPAIPPHRPWAGRTAPSGTPEPLTTALQL
jgi:hypothetical protein